MTSRACRVSPQLTGTLSGSQSDSDEEGAKEAPTAAAAAAFDAAAALDAAAGVLRSPPHRARGAPPAPDSDDDEAAPKSGGGDERGRGSSCTGRHCVGDHGAASDISISGASVAYKVRLPVCVSASLLSQAV